MSRIKTIHELLQQHFPSNEIVGRDVVYRELSRRMNACLRPFQIKGKIVRSKAHHTDKKQIFDFWGGIEQIGLTQKYRVTVSLCVSDIRKHARFSQQTLKKFKFGLASVVLHELIHLDQFQNHKKERNIPVFHSGRIGEKRLKEIDYYRSWYEIDAYGHDLAMEIRYHYPDIDSGKVFRYIDEYSKLRTFRVFKNVFRGTEWSQVRELLLRRALKWYRALDKTIIW